MALSQDQVSELRERALALHRDHHGKVGIVSKIPARNQDDLSLAYTPGVAEACREIYRDNALAFELTNRANLVAVVTDGSAVLGLGDIGPSAAMPVMEGKSVIFKAFAGVDAIPLCLATQDVDQIVAVVRALEPTFGGINLEDISAPRCFAIEGRLREELSIPVFHDDQHGSAIVTTAAMINSLRIVGKAYKDIKVVINGAGAAGIGTARMLRDLGVANIVLCDRVGAIFDGRDHLNDVKADVARITNLEREKGSLASVLRGADVFVGLSIGGCVSVEMVRAMAPRAVIMAMANPEPEIHPDEAREGGAEVICTGRMDYPNQINNSSAFPGIFRGALDTRARAVNEKMKMAAAEAIAGLVSPADVERGIVMPDNSDARIAPAVAGAVAAAAVASGVARVHATADEVAERTRQLAARAARLNQGALSS